MIGDSAKLKALDPGQFVDEQFGLPTIKDIIAELEKPGRDPRPQFKAVRFADGIEKITDLVVDQILEGKVTNVTAFGAFVDVGVHQDGLVHISALSHTFVKDPREVVKAGDIVKVKVMNVDVQRQRIALSMRLDDSAEDAGASGSTRSGNEPGRSIGRQSSVARKGGNAQNQPASGGRHNRKNTQQSHGVKPSAPSVDQPSALALQLKAALATKK